MHLELTDPYVNVDLSGHHYLKFSCVCESIYSLESIRTIDVSLMWIRFKRLDHLEMVVTKKRRLLRKIIYNSCIELIKLVLVGMIIANS